MAVSGDPVANLGDIDVIIREVPNSLQKQQTVLSPARGDSAKFGCNYRWCEDFTEHHLGRVSSILHDQPWASTANTSVSRGSNTISLPTSEAIGEMDTAPGNAILSNSRSNQCSVEVHSSENSKVLVRSNSNRFQCDKSVFIGPSIAQRPSEQSSPSTKPDNECYSTVGEMGNWKLCRDDSFDTSIMLEEGLANPIPFDLDAYGSNETTLQKLPQDLETQCSGDIPSLLGILTRIYPFHKISTNVFDEYEINDFSKLYGISNVRPILASDDDHNFWLEDTAGIVYMWTRINGTMFYLGQDLREALVTYLFHPDNICYVAEFTHEIVPRNQLLQKAKELAESFRTTETTEVEVTKELLKPLKRDGKRDKKKKGKKKKNKH